MAKFWFWDGKWIKIEFVIKKMIKNQTWGEKWLNIKFEVKNDENRDWNEKKKKFYRKSGKCWIIDKQVL